TSVEKTLLEHGHEKAVADQRAAFQDAMRPQFKRVVEEEMHRRVLAFMSSTHSNQDLSAELFVLAPPEDGVAAEAEAIGRQDGERIATQDGFAGSDGGARRDGGAPQDDGAHLGGRGG